MQTIVTIRNELVVRVIGSKLREGCIRKTTNVFACEYMGLEWFNLFAETFIIHSTAHFI